MAAQRNLTIAGGGIGGLTAALALSRAGFHASVLERAPQFEPFGAGIQLSPNASRVLFALGLGDALSKVASEPERLIVRRGSDGEELASMPMGGTMKQRFGAPYMILHRADLHSILRMAAEQDAGIGVVMGTSVSDFTVHANGVTVMAERDHALEEFRTAGLIGADGVRSTVRKRLYPASTLIKPGRSAWRATLPAHTIEADIETNTVGLWLGSDAHVVHYPLRGGSLVNLVAVAHDGWHSESWNAPGDRDVLAARFASWADPVRALIEAAPSVSRWALADMKTLRRWGEGPVTLLGDAAHPMLPFIAQGGGMAIEDAMTLARVLREAPDNLAKGFRKYERLRRHRTARVQREARRNDRTYHMAGPMAFFRNQVLGLVSGSKMIDRYNWLYGHKA
jgi:salicylate hydroxylase